MLVLTIVVAGDCSRTDICASADYGVTDVAEMIDLCTFADPGFLDLAEIADLDLFRQFRAGPEPRKGSDLGICAHRRSLKMAECMMTALAPTRTPGPNQTLGSMVTSLPSSVSKER
jgi:hypothetical protein